MPCRFLHFLIVTIAATFALPAFACSCIEQSDRSIFATSRAVVIMKIMAAEPVTAPRDGDDGDTEQKVRAHVRRAWLDQSLVNSDIELTQSVSWFPGVDCGNRALNEGAIWIADIDQEQRRQIAYSDCSWAKLWSNDSKQHDRFDALEKEFLYRRRMQESDWTRALAPILAPATTLAGGIAAEGCMDRLDLETKSGCIGGKRWRQGVLGGLRGWSLA